MSLLLALLLATPPAPPAPMSACLPDGSGFLRARLKGDIELDIDWRGDAVNCAGMPRPDGLGLRVRFAGGGERKLALLFAAPRLGAGESATAVPVNVTVVEEGAARIYGTLGADKCLLDRVTQSRLAGPDLPPDTWRIEARGFCTEPARAPVGNARVLVTTFEFVGRVSFGEDPGAEPPGVEQHGRAALPGNADPEAAR